MTDPNSQYGSEFQEVGHCGGKFTIDVRTSEDGRRGISFGIRSSRPNPAAWFGVYALPQGIPVGTIQLGGIGQPWNPSPYPFCLSIFIASDSQGKFGHQCPDCAGYWRSGGAPAKWKMTCPYCGNRGDAHQFLTQGQLKYLEACCALADQAMSDPEDGEHIIDMDEVADAVGKEGERPAFYYAEETQQNKFTCRACGDFNDILGRYGYCSSCGTHNGVSELEADLKAIRASADANLDYSTCVKGTVAAFDSYSRQIAKQLASRIPMTPARRKEWERKLFHNLKACADELESTFDIRPFRSMNQDEIAFATLMFHRRHVYEHNGGEVDEKYIRDSGDTTVRPKQVIRETSQSASRISDLVLRMTQNIDKSFHEIFAPEKLPLQYQKARLDQK